MFDNWTHRSLPQEIHGGTGVLDHLGDLLKSFGARRVLLVASRRMLDSEPGELVTKQLGRMLAGTFSETRPYVDAHTAQHAVLSARSSEADTLVSLGSGANIEMAKAIAFFSEMESGMSGRSVADRPKFPHVAIPTTLNGAPYTGEFSLIDSHTKRSSSAGSPTSTPMAVLLEHSFQSDTDSESFILRATVALAHAIDVLTGTQASPEARMLARQGLIELAQRLPEFHADPKEFGLLESVIDATVVCGRARQNASAGFQHTLAQLLGARTLSSYELVSASLLPYTTAFISDVLPASTSELLNTLFMHEPTELGLRLSWWLEDIGVHNAFYDLEIDHEDIEAVARQATAHRGVQLCARPAGEGDIYALLKEALGIK